MGKTVQTVEATEVMSSAASERSALLQAIMQVAKDPTVDLDRMERLFKMHQEMESREQERLFNAAMTAAQAEIRPVVRDAQNDHTKSAYARLETISDVLTPIITKHGFSTQFSTADCPLPNHHRIVCKVAHIGGHKEFVHADLPADVAGSQGKANKTAIQGFGSTMSYGRRYLKLLIFDVALKNEDNDGNRVGNPITEEQAIELRTTIEAIAQATGTTVDGTLQNFCGYLKIDKLTELPADRHDEAKAILAQKLKETNPAKVKPAQKARSTEHGDEEIPF